MRIMDDETQLKVRKFLKRLGISSQQELNQFIENCLSEQMQMFARSGCAVTGQIDLKPLNLRIVFALDFLFNTVFKF